MSADNTLDRETFQSLLSSAFSVQQSGMAPQSLAAIIEIQRSISHEDLDPDSAMNLIADRARVVADASGIGIALLDGNQLVHRAGTGSASQTVGSQLAAVLGTSGNGHLRREILRVEDARTDSRIEADICRQFDAQALLMVPIYRERILIGMLEVLFNEPHRFEEPEVRTYQLLATLAGDASTLPTQLNAERWAPSSGISEALGRIRPQVQQLGMLHESARHPEPRTSSDLLSRRVSSSGAQISPVQSVSWLVRFTRERLRVLSLPKLLLPRMRLPELEMPSSLVRALDWRKLVAKWSRPSWLVGRSSAATAAVVVLAVALVSAGYISRHGTTSRSADSPAEPKDAAGSPTPPATPEPTSATRVPKQNAGTPAQDAKAPNSGFKRLRIGNDEVDYIADDVTVRHFRSAPTASDSHQWNKQVDLGEDVTVRYFGDPQNLSHGQSISATEQSLRN